MEKILLECGLPKESDTAIMMLYKNTKVMVCLPDGDIEFFNVVSGIFPRDTL